MLCEIYIEALLVYEEVADQVQAALMAGEIDDSTGIVKLTDFMEISLIAMPAKLLILGPG